ncbi:MAG TPA: hypothetical protein VK489_02335 [Ferruginibacter sp.]|nr:hypothetical protein [Ferruginibacter sp.]
MKRNIIIAMLGLTTVFATSSFTNAGSEISSTNITQTGSKPGTLISAPLDGIWSGYFSNSIGTAYYFYQLTFYSDGSLMVEQASSVGYGSWTLVGDQLSATYIITDVDPQYAKAEGEGDSYSLNGRVAGNNISGSLSGSNNANFVFSVTQQ